MMRSEEIRDRLKDIDEFLLKQYKENKVEKKRDWRTYEQQLSKRIKGAIRNLELVLGLINIIAYRRTWIDSGKQRSMSFREKMQH